MEHASTAMHTTKDEERRTPSTQVRDRGVGFDVVGLDEGIEGLEQHSNNKSGILGGRIASTWRPRTGFFYFQPTLDFFANKYFRANGTVK